MNRFFSTLSLCRKAGKVVFGFDAVCDEMAKPATKVCGVITASDLSAKTKKEIAFMCDKYNIKLYPADVTMDEIRTVISKRTGIIAILDEGLFRSLAN